MHSFKKLFNLLNKKERVYLALLFLMTLGMALLDMLGVASIMPFIAVLTNSDLVESNKYLNKAFEFSNTFGITTHQEFLFFLGILVFVLLVFSLAFKALTTFTLNRFSLMREYSIGSRLIEGYLHQSYSWFLDRHSADLGKSILSEVNLVIYQALIPAINLVTQSLVALTILILLILVDAKLAFIIGVVLGSSYGLIYKLTTRYLVDIGEGRLNENKKRFITVNEGFGAIKEVKVGGLESVYTRRFSASAQAYAKYESAAQAIGQLPRFALEAIAFGGLLLVMLYLMGEGSGAENALPVVALYAFAGYRLMPAVQLIYSAITQLRYSGPVLDEVYKNVKGLPKVSRAFKEPDVRAVVADQEGFNAIQFSEFIELKNITYKYANSVRPALMNVNLLIPVKSKIGLVGGTGSGKTTLVDLVLGLLEIQGGEIRVDGTVISNNNVRDWQRSIGYVPQQIFLTDDSVIANIAFGVEAKDIDFLAVEKVAKIANLHEFVVNDLAHGYETPVGERGVRLSGGQRQRIGIARALYHNPQVLILDEATSALDNVTEQAVMDAIHNLGNEITIIMIAHRLSTVKTCDKVFLLDKGELKASGSYEELESSSELFKKMIGKLV